MRASSCLWSSAWRPARPKRSSALSGGDSKVPPSPTSLGIGSFTDWSSPSTAVSWSPGRRPSSSSIRSSRFVSARGPEDRIRIADVGTGSGAVGVSVAVHVPQATVYATDISREALRVANANRRRHGVEDRVQLVQSDLLEGLAGKFDVIVSNPPYIKSGEIGGLAAEIEREPPRVPWTGGADGLAVTGRLLRQTSTRLRPGGLVLVEIGEGPARIRTGAGRTGPPRRRGLLHQRPDRPPAGRFGGAGPTGRKVVARACPRSGRDSSGRAPVTADRPEPK